jgi:brefeldin A-inhibited guanine nucleotide-exchange protein
LDAVYSTSNPLHLSALLKAVRTTYNIFLLSRNNDNQNVAQITMTQMVDHIFRRVKSNPNHIVDAVQETPVAEVTETSNTDSVNENEVDEIKDKEDQEGDTEISAVNGVAPNAPIETEAESNTYQQQIIVEANMARTEMDHKLPSGRSKDNYEDFLNDTANVFQEEQQQQQQNGASTVHHNALTTVPTNDTT